MSRVVSLHSFRGGTGKSNTAANLAASLAKRGQRVALIDTDIQSPGIHALFGVNPADPDAGHFTLNDYIWGRCDVEQTAIDVTPPEVAGVGNIQLVPSSLKPGEIARVLREGYDVELLSDGLRELSDRLALDTLLVDKHPGLNEETLLSIALSDLLLVLMRPDQQDFQGTAVTLDVARKLDLHETYLVLNKVLDRLDPVALKAEVETSFGATVVASLPESEDLLALGSAGIFSLLHPEHRFSQAVDALAERVAISRTGSRGGRRNERA